MRQDPKFAKCIQKLRNLSMYAKGATEDGAPSLTTLTLRKVKFEK